MKAHKFKPVFACEHCTELRAELDSRQAEAILALHNVVSRNPYAWDTAVTILGDARHIMGRIQEHLDMAHGIGVNELPDAVEVPW